MAVANARPVSAEDFAKAMSAFSLPPQPHIAVAVSGGGDSVALALLLKEWLTPQNGQLQAFIVDHRLRPESAQEAQHVANLMAAHRIPADILCWLDKDHGPQGSRIQERARHARYELLTVACLEKKIPILALGHQCEDQIETFWMRLAAGSGVDGLAGMAPCRVSPLSPDLMMIRPLLSFSRAALRATCSARNVTWIEDPSNQNDQFLRVRLRQFEGALAAEGLTPDRLLRTVQKFHRAREALDYHAAEAFQRCLYTADKGEIVLDWETWAAYPAETQSRILCKAVQQVRLTSPLYPPRSQSIETLRQAVLEKGFKGHTVAGCQVTLRRGKICIRPEQGATYAAADNT